MSDLKSKLPDMNELGKFASKLFGDVKTSVVEIIADYKKKRNPEGTPVTTEKKEPPTATATAPKKEEYTTKDE